MVDANGMPTRQTQLLLTALTQPGNITSYDLADGAVITTKLANGAVSTDKLPDSVITETKIADNSISTSKIVANAITSNLIAAGAIVADKIFAKSIVTEKIDIGAVVTDTIGYNAVSNSVGGTSNSATATISLNLQQGDRVSVLATSSQGSSSASSYSGSLAASVLIPSGGTVSIGSIGLTSFIESVAPSYANNTIVPGVGGSGGGQYIYTQFQALTIVASYKIPNATLLVFYNATESGPHTFSATNAFSSTTSIMVIGLAR
jgi:hypothetical protein